VNQSISRDATIFVGLNRHDVVITNDVISYFVLNRKSSTRYHELHPAVADTAAVQREIIGDLRDENVDMLILRYIFSDQHLERVKKDFQKNLPHVGATVLDEFIREHYVPVERFGSYTVWRQKGSIGSRAGKLAPSTQ
jgi:hypothetical protein